MGYIIQADYLKSIQNANLQQIITANPAVQDSAEKAAQAEALSYLRQKYDVAKEFTNTTQWDFTAPYSAYDRVYLNATAYATGTTYNINDLALYNSKVYSCNTDGTTGTFNPAFWDLLGDQYQIFYALPPYQPFNYKAYYNVDDRVYYKGNIYKCLTQTTLLAHEDILQYRETENVPYKNVWPDDPVYGKQYWYDEGAYLIPAATYLITNEAFWSDSDNRDQQMVMYFIDITLYHIHQRIAPQNIPVLRVERYHNAIDWLKMCAKGDVTPNLPMLQPNQGKRIRYGGDIRNINSY